mmetsp:Transcript_20043/g.28582  ORF Transcript_20043/g.28582 Transcript_20043/m.28582 type:complete len:94 (-) Transcript_20043:14-295(-)
MFTGGTLDTHRAADVGKVPFGGQGVEGRGLGNGLVDGESIGRGGEEGDEGGGVLHGAGGIYLNDNSNAPVARDGLVAACMLDGKGRLDGGGEI